MIAKEDLKLGNIVTYQGVQCSVFVIGENGIGIRDKSGNNTVVSEDKIEPIPITEELLLKLGFEKTFFKIITTRRIYTKYEGEYSFEYEFLEDGIRTEFMCLGIRRYDIRTLDQHIDIKVDFLHELQQEFKNRTKKDLMYDLYRN